MPIKILSIVVPSYNVQKYLDKCLTSLIIEDYMHKLEVIIVNDGSTDNTEQIALKYVSMYPQTFKLFNKENGGHGSALNFGISHTTGKYIKMIDADDWVITENMPYLIDQLDSNNADVVLTNFHTVDMYTGEKLPHTIDSKYSNQEIIIKQFLEIFYELEFICYHNIFYKRVTYLESNVNITEKVRYFADQYYSICPLCKVNTILMLPIFIYQYMVNNPTQSVAIEPQKKIDQTIVVIKEIIEYYLNSLPMKEEVSLLLLHLIKGVFLTLSMTIMFDLKDKKNGRNQMKELENYLAEKLPQILEMTKKKRMLFKLCNRFHISRKTYNNFSKIKKQFF